jgi:Fic family protein
VFSPRYIITNKVLNNLIDLEKSALLVNLAPLQADWEVKLKQESLGRREYAVLKYLDGQLSVDDVAKIVKDEPGRDDKPNQVALRAGVVAKEKDVQKAINWLNTNKLVEQTAYLSNKFKQGVFEEKDLLAINSLLGERVVVSANLGKYRDKMSLEVPEVKLPPAVEVPYQMEDLFSWFKGAGKTELHTILKAGTLFLELVRIRPFIEDNVSTGLFFFELILASENLSLKGIWSIEEEMLKNKQKFEQIMAESVEGGDLTSWFEFLTKVMAEAAEKAKIKVMNLVGEGPIFKTETGRAISLSERQIAMMEELTIRNETTIKEIRAILPMVSDDTILRDLKDLILKKLIKKKGKTKGAVYVLGKVKGFK